MKTFQIDGRFSVVVPNDWVIEIGQVTSFYEPENGSGALQFSFYVTEDEAVASVVELLQEFLEDRFKNAGIVINQGYAYFEGIDAKDHFWRYWAFTKADVAAFVTYNCEKNDQFKEYDTINNIMTSVFF